MNAKIVVYAGLVLFVGLVTFPVWYGTAQGRTAHRPEIVIRTANVPGKDRCIMPLESMRASHVHLLKDWREAVVRTGDRDYTSPDGRRFRRSLTGTCLDCHSNKSSFCDRCHNYVGARPNCWNCHVAPDAEAR